MSNVKSNQINYDNLTTLHKICINFF